MADEDQSQYDGEGEEPQPCECTQRTEKPSPGGKCETCGGSGGMSGKEVNNMNEINVNGIVYVPKGIELQNTSMATSLEGKKYVIVRTYSAGVFAGYLDSRKGQEVVVLKARRLFYWEGAASLSQLALEGVKKPDKCKFPAELPRVELLQAIEIIDVTEAARKNIAEVPVWAMTE